MRSLEIVFEIFNIRDTPELLILSINYSGISAFVYSSDQVTLLSSLLIELDAILISVIHNS